MTRRIGLGWFTKIITLRVESVVRFVLSISKSPKHDSAGKVSGSSTTEDYVKNLPEEAQAEHFLIRAVSSFLKNTDATDSDALVDFRKAVGLKSVIASYFLGVCYCLGRGVPADYAEGFHCFKKSADCFHADSAFLVSICFMYGIGTKISMIQSFNYCQISADLGNQEAQYHTGLNFIRSREPYQAELYLTRSSQQGYVPALHVLGRYFKSRKEYDKAVHCFSKAASLGHEEAMFELGICYSYGLGVAVDKSLAFKYFELAANRGVIEAQCLVGICYYHARGTHKNESEASKYLLSASKKAGPVHSESSSCFNLCYNEGVGLENDTPKAIRALTWGLSVSRTANTNEEYAVINNLFDKAMRVLSKHHSKCLTLNVFGHDRHRKNSSRGQITSSLLSLMSGIVAYSSAADIDALYSVICLPNVKAPPNTLAQGLIQCGAALKDEQLVKFKHISDRENVEPHEKSSEYMNYEDLTVTVHMHSGEVVYEPHHVVSREDINQMHLISDEKRATIPRIRKAWITWRRKHTMKSSEMKVESEDATLGDISSAMEVVPQSSLLKGMDSNYKPNRTNRWNSAVNDMIDGAELLTAVHNQATEIVERLIIKGVNASFSFEDGVTGSTIASYYGNTEMLRLLGHDSMLLSFPERENLSVAVYENYRLLSSSTVKTMSLQVCCEYGLIDTLKSLIAMGADVNGVTCKGKSPLYIACQSRNLEIVRLLLSYNARVDIPDENGQTALHACKDWFGYSLVSRPLTPRFNAAIRMNDIESIKYLHSVGMLYDCDGNSMLVQACHYSSDDTVSYILSLGVDVNSINGDRSTSLMWAAFMGKVNVVKMLLEAKANIALKDIFDWTVFNYLELDEHQEISELLILYNKQVAPTNEPAMDVVNGDSKKRTYEEILDSQIMSWVDGDDQNNSKMIRFSSDAKDKHLVKCQSDFDEMTLEDETAPIEAMSKSEAVATVTSLIESVSQLKYGVNCPPKVLAQVELIARYPDSDVVNFRHPGSLTCLLHELCRLNMYECVRRMLTNRELKIDRKDGRLCTSLTVVVMTHQDPEMIKLLLDHDADVLHRNEMNYCSLHYAAKLANSDLLTLLFSKISPFVKIPNILPCVCDHAELQSTSEEMKLRRLDLMKSLLKTRYAIDDIVNDQGDTIQMHCCRLSSADMFVKLTIEMGANPEIENLSGETALKLSVRKSWWRSISYNSYEKLWMALAVNDVNEIKRLEKVGVQLSECNSKGDYPLIFAAQNSSDEVMTLFISLGANVNVCVEGCTPLLAAASKGVTSKIALLIDNGADLCARDSNENNLFHLMAQGSHIDALKVAVYRTMKRDSVLLTQLVNDCNRKGYTPVMVAAESLSKECVDFLSAAGSEVIDIDNGMVKVPKKLFLAKEAEDAKARAAEHGKPVDHSAAMEVVTNAAASAALVKTSSSGGTTASSATPAVPGEAEVIAPPPELSIQKMLTRQFVERLYHACKFGLTPVVLALLALLKSEQQSGQKSEKEIRDIINEKVDETNYVMVKDKLTEVLTSETCLYVACYYGHTEIVKELLMCGAKPNIIARNGWSCLFVASKKGYLEIVRMLVGENEKVAVSKENRADVNVKNRNDMTSLNIAAYGGFVEIVKLLVDLKADVNQGDKMGARPLHAAIQSGKFEVVDYLLDHGADINGVTNTDIGPLYVASYSGNAEMVARFLTYVPPPVYPELKRVNIDAMNREGLTAITVAAFNGHLSIVSMLLNAGADLNKTEKKKVTSLYAACQNGFMEVVNLLLSRGADPKTPIGNLNTPVHAVAIENKFDILKVLIEHKAPIDTTNVDGVTPLYMACEKGHLETLEILIQQGANVDTPNKHTVSPLNIASQNGHFKIVEKLIACNANVNSQTEDGPTPLFIAAQNGHTEICRVLLEAGAEVDTRTKEKETAIFVAGYFGYVEIVKLLIKFKASINIVDRDTRTPLWWACKAGQEEVVKLYMEAGADVNISDREHVTPMMIAAQQRKVAVCELLNAAKAQATLCAICLTNQRCCLFMPCKHLASCADCSLKLERSQSKVCPICRSAVTEVVTVFT